jgi:hypothetical protein
MLLRIRQITVTALVLRRIRGFLEIVDGNPASAQFWNRSASGMDVLPNRTPGMRKKEGEKYEVDWNMDHSTELPWCGGPAGSAGACTRTRRGTGRTNRAWCASTARLKISGVSSCQL